MSRSGYSDDCENVQLWRGNVDRAIHGKAGQAFFKELLAALDALPHKRLIPHELVDGSECCALGAVALSRGMDVTKIDESEPEEVAAAFGIRGMLAQEIAYMNDEYKGSQEAPEARFERVRKWVIANLAVSNPRSEQK